MFDPRKKCPLSNDPCLEHQCQWFISLKGQSPQGGPVDEWGCAIAWLPLLLVENSAESRHTTASIDRFNNSMLKQNTELAQLLVTESKNVL